MARSIFIGDVHGCAAELAELLDLVGPTAEDAVYLVGDLIARGPDTSGVLRLVREVHGKSVLGNHEAHVLQVRRARLAGEETRRLSPTHEALFSELSEADWSLLDSLPLYVDAATHDVRLVHAGVLPGLSFHQQDVWTLTHIRSVTDKGLASDLAGAESWAAIYRGTRHLVFGHDARRGLQLHSHATGLDTACVYGGSLTALVLPRGEAMPFPNDRRELLVSVRARAAYFTGGERPAP